MIKFHRVHCDLNFYHLISPSLELQFILTMTTTSFSCNLQAVLHRSYPQSTSPLCSAIKFM